MLPWTRLARASIAAGVLASLLASTQRVAAQAAGAMPGAAGAGGCGPEPAPSLVGIGTLLEQTSVLFEAPRALTIETTTRPISRASAADGLALSTSLARHPGGHHVFCAPLAEVAKTLVCAFSDETAMNGALARASRSIERTHAIPDHEENLRHLHALAGHDLQGRDLLDFWTRFTGERVTFARPSSTWTRGEELLQIEDDFWNHVLLPRLRADPDWTLIAYAPGDDPEPLAHAVLDHEVSHARFFRDPAYRAAAIRFWREEVAPEDRQAILEQFRHHYDVADERLVANEFQAYVLEREPSLDPGVVDRYRERLRRALRLPKPA